MMKNTMCNQQSISVHLAETILASFPSQWIEARKFSKHFNGIGLWMRYPTKTLNQFCSFRGHMVSSFFYFVQFQLCEFVASSSCIPTRKNVIRKINCFNRSLDVQFCLHEKVDMQVCWLLVQRYLIQSIQ